MRVQCYNNILHTIDHAALYAVGAAAAQVLGAVAEVSVCMF